MRSKSTYEFRLLVDDAHGFGTMGETGAGVGEMLGCQDGIDLYFSTFAKSMAAIGAFVAADHDIIMYLKYNMRSQTYAKALPMPYVVGGLKRLDMIRNSSEFRDKLWENVRAIQSGLRERGFDIGETESPVTPVFLHHIEGGVAEVATLTKDFAKTWACSVPLLYTRLFQKVRSCYGSFQRLLTRWLMLIIPWMPFSKMGDKLKKGVYRGNTSSIAPKTIEVSAEAATE